MPGCWDCQAVSFRLAGFLDGSVQTGLPGVAGFVLPLVELCLGDEDAGDGEAESVVPGVDGEHASGFGDEGAGDAGRAWAACSYTESPVGFVGAGVGERSGAEGVQDCVAEEPELMDCVELLGHP